MLWYFVVLCYIFSHVERALVLWNIVLYIFRLCCVLVVCVLLRENQKNDVFLFCVCRTGSVIVLYIFLCVERALVFFVLYISSCGTRSGILCYFSAYGIHSGILCSIFLRVERALIFYVIFFCM